MTALEIYGGFAAITILLLILATFLRLRGYEIERKFDLVALIPTVLGIWAFVDELQDVRTLNRNFEILNERFTRAETSGEKEEKYNRMITGSVSSINVLLNFCEKISSVGESEYTDLIVALISRSVLPSSPTESMASFARSAYCDLARRELNSQKELALSLSEFLRGESGSLLRAIYYRSGRYKEIDAYCPHLLNLSDEQSSFCIRVTATSVTLLINSEEDLKYVHSWRHRDLFLEIPQTEFIQTFISGIERKDSIWSEVLFDFSVAEMAPNLEKLESIDSGDQFLWAYLLSFAVALEVAKIVSAPLAGGITKRRRAAASNAQLTLPLEKPPNT